MWAGFWCFVGLFKLLSWIIGRGRQHIWYSSKALPFRKISGSLVLWLMFSLSHSHTHLHSHSNLHFHYSPAKVDRAEIIISISQKRKPRHRLKHRHHTYFNGRDGTITLVKGKVRFGLMSGLLHSIVSRILGRMSAQSKSISHSFPWIYLNFSPKCSFCLDLNCSPLEMKEDSEGKSRGASENVSDLRI